MKATAKKQADPAAVNGYLAKQPESSRLGLERLRQAIAAAAPTATQCISYGIPAFRWNGRVLVWFAGFRKHSSFFPGVAAIRRHAAELEGYKTSKGTIQFPPDRPLSKALTAKLVRARMAELRETGRNKAEPV